MNANDIDFKTCYLSEPGVFIKNKGCFVFKELEHFAFWLVVDGMEYLPGKDSVEVIIDQLCTDLEADTSLNRNHIKKCLNKAHSLLKNAGNSLSLKASLVLVVTDYSEVIWAISGNCRMYLVREHQLAFRSRDQSVAQSLIESDIINEDDMTTVADRDILTNYLGIEFGFAPFISNRFKLQAGDIIIICNLGFWEQLRSEPFEELLRTVFDPTELLPIIKERFLDRDTLALNNYIVGLIAVRQVLSRRKPGRLSFHLEKKKVIALFLVIVVGLGGLIATKIASKMKLSRETQLKVIKAETQQQIINNYIKKGDLLLKKGEYKEANSEYNNALNSLKTCPNNDTEKIIKLKINIIPLLKEGDDFFVKENYRKALKCYEMAREFDVSGYFRIQTEKKIADAQQYLNRNLAKQRIPIITRKKVSESLKEEPTIQNLAKPKKHLAVHSGLKATVNIGPKASSTPMSMKSFAKSPVKSPILRNEPRKLKAVTKETHNPNVANDKIVVKPNGTSKNNYNINPKPTIPAAKNSQSDKKMFKDTDTSTVDQGKLMKATELVKKGDELADGKKYRQAVRFYKKAKNIYRKANQTIKVTQLDNKIDAAKKKMHRSFEGSR